MKTRRGQVQWPLNYISVTVQVREYWLSGVCGRWSGVGKSLIPYGGNVIN